MESRAGGMHELAWLFRYRSAGLLRTSPRPRRESSVVMFIYLRCVSLVSIDTVSVHSPFAYRDATCVFTASCSQRAFRHRQQRARVCGYSGVAPGRRMSR